MAKVELEVKDLEALSGKDSIALANNKGPQTLEDIIRAMAQLDVTVSAINKAMVSLQEKLNSFTKEEIEDAFAGKAVRIKGKTYQVVHKESVDMDYNVETLEKIPAAAPFLKEVAAYHKFDQASYNKAVAAGTVDTSVSSAITVTTTHKNVLKEVK